MDLKFKAAFVVLFCAFVILLLGCVQPPICGNNVCEAGENSSTCPQDCGSIPSVGYLQATVTNANTFSPVGAANVSVWEKSSSSDICVIDISNPPAQISAKTDDKGIASFTLDAGKVYCSEASADGYEFRDSFKEAKIYQGQTTAVDLNLYPYPKCQNLPGTQKFMVGDSVNVDGGVSFTGKTLKLIFWDIYTLNSQGPYGVTMQVWLDGNLIKVVNEVPPFEARAMFGNDIISSDMNVFDVCNEGGEWKIEASPVVSSTDAATVISTGVKAAAPSGVTTTGKFTLKPNELVYVGDVATRTNLSNSAIFFGVKRDTNLSLGRNGDHFSNPSNLSMDANAIVACKQTATLLDTMIAANYSSNYFLFNTSAAVYCGTNQPCCVAIIQKR